MTKTILVTGSSGLVGSEVCWHFAELGWEVFGIDNYGRRKLLGDGPNSFGNDRSLKWCNGNFMHEDVCDRRRMDWRIGKIKPSLIVHAAGQPSHDLSAKIPLEDFDINAVGTLNVLEAARQHCPESPFVFLSTNKVYGDRPNFYMHTESEDRYDFHRMSNAFEGITEMLSVDVCLHSPFGVSKLAADLMVQEYGRYFDMPTVCLRCGCITGPNHAGVELHGFLSYLVRCNLEGREYKIFGYKGKQVRDNLHAVDVARFVEEFAKAPRKAAVYNLGGGKANSCSILEAFKLVESVTGLPMKSVYVDQPRKGDHICYYSDLRRVMHDYPGWSVSRTLEEIVVEIVQGWRERL